MHWNRGRKETGAAVESFVCQVHGLGTGLAAKAERPRVDVALTGQVSGAATCPERSRRNPGMNYFVAPPSS